MKGEKKMELNINFNKRIGWIIDKNKSLSDWFERNQEWMAYFGLTHAGCLHFDEIVASDDIRILGRMANAALTILEDKGPIDAIKMADNAAKAIAEIYELNKDNLTETARKLYAIDIEPLEKKNKEVDLHILVKRNGNKNRRPGGGHRRH